MLIAIILAIIFVPLLFVMGIKTGMEQADSKWIKIMKENTTDTQATITKLQSKLKEKNEELSKLKDSQKNQEQNIKSISEEAESLRLENKNFASKVKRLENEKCVHEEGIFIDDNGNYHCPIVYKYEHAPPKAFL